MTKKQKIEEIADAMRYTGDKEEAGKNNERPEIYILNEKKTKTREILFKLIWDDNIGGTNDLSYEICAKACDIIRDVDLEDLENEDLFYENESASVYTSSRIAYLNAKNQDDIIAILKMHNCDIQQACAVWYDDMVRSVAMTLKNYLLDDENAV
jgi:hypothetical protein